jgi:hypothetical protein
VHGNLVEHPEWDDRYMTYEHEWVYNDVLKKVKIILKYLAAF